MTVQPRHQMNEALEGRQHTDMAHRISFRRASWWRRNGSVAWQALCYAFVLLVLTLAFLTFGDLK